MGFPQTRLRRLRLNKTLRDLFSDVELNSNDFIQPIFITDGKNINSPIEALPGINKYSTDKVLKYCEDLLNDGVKTVILFGISTKKDESGLISCNENAIIPKAIRLIKKKFPQLLIIADLCNCEYTTHGHCGTVLESGYVDNDKTIKTLCKQAIVLSNAGADILAPSDMMDGRVMEIRKTLDRNDAVNTLIFPYSVKYASSYYGPFRKAANINLNKGSREQYQMNFKNSYNFEREVKLDINEGADAIIIKPALAYLDIIYKTKKKFNIPIISYNVSGEYLLLKEFEKNNFFNYERLLIETISSIKRAGSDAIISYHSQELIKILKKLQ